MTRTLYAAMASSFPRSNGSVLFSDVTVPGFKSYGSQIFLRSFLRQAESRGDYSSALKMRAVSPAEILTLTLTAAKPCGAQCRRASRETFVLAYVTVRCLTSPRSAMRRDHSGFKNSFSELPEEPQIRARHQTVVSRTRLSRWKMDCLECQG